MADRRRRCDHVHLEYIFDRLLATKLERVYEILVPDCARRAGEPAALKGEPHEDRRDPRSNRSRRRPSPARLRH